MTSHKNPDNICNKSVGFAIIITLVLFYLLLFGSILGEFLCYYELTPLMEWCNNYKQKLFHGLLISLILAWILNLLWVIRMVLIHFSNQIKSSFKTNEEIVKFNAQ
jgi:hypothetical protein